MEGNPVGHRDGDRGAAWHTGPDLHSTVASLRIEFAARTKAVEAAARDWGIRPNYPEGVFVSAMLSTQAGFSDLALSLADVLQTVVSEARAAAEDELARQRVLTQQTRAALENASGAIFNMEKGGRDAIARLEVEKTKVTTQLIDRMVPDMIRGVKDALVIKERRRDRNLEWTRALGAGGIALALVVSGYVWASWSDWGMASRVESIGAAIEHCQLTSKWADDKGHRLCQMSDFIQN